MLGGEIDQGDRGYEVTPKDDAAYDKGIGVEDVIRPAAEAVVSEGGERDGRRGRHVNQCVSGTILGAGRAKMLWIAPRTGKASTDEPGSAAPIILQSATASGAAGANMPPCPRPYHFPLWPVD